MPGKTKKRSSRKPKRRTRKSKHRGGGWFGKKKERTWPEGCYGFGMSPKDTPHKHCKKLGEEACKLEEVDDEGFDTMGPIGCSWCSQDQCIMNKYGGSRNSARRNRKPRRKRRSSRKPKRKTRKSRRK